MASPRSLLRFFQLGALSTLFAMAGCQSPQAADNIPAPNFNGPVVLAAPAPIAPAHAPHIEPSVSHESIKYSGNVPKDWIPYATARPWKWIVIHHSATPTGSAAVFDRMHRDKGWDELGYDFVIGNGTNSGNGQIEVGPRWPKQKWGAHAKTPDNRYNDFGIGICLVGNFDVERPTPEQIRSLARLVSYLARTYHIQPQNVIGHGDTKPTDCPGRYMNVAAIRRQVTQMLADVGDFDPLHFFNDSPTSVQLTAEVTDTSLLTDTPAN